MRKRKRWFTRRGKTSGRWAVQEEEERACRRWGGSAAVGGTFSRATVGGVLLLLGDYRVRRIRWRQGRGERSRGANTGPLPYSNRGQRERVREWAGFTRGLAYFSHKPEHVECYTIFLYFTRQNKGLRGCAGVTMETPLPHSSCLRCGRSTPCRRTVLLAIFMPPDRSARL